MEIREAFTFDPVGNMLTAPVGRTFGYNSSNQLMTMNGQAAFQYDQNGNRTWANTGLLPWTHTWDFEDRLTAAIIINGTNISFTYDPFGRRIKKTQAANTTIYIYDGANLIEEVNGVGNEIARYTHGPNIDEPLAQLRGGVTSYYQADGLGSVTSLTNAGGTIANWYSYSSFGGNAGTSGSVVNPFRFTGREYDSETGLYYYRARYYDVGVDRFISEDPIRFSGGINYYLYTRNNPALRVDPSGLSSLIFNSTTGALTVVNGLGQAIGTFPAGNNAQIGSRGSWAAGTYHYAYHTRHPDDGPDSQFGSYGNWVFNVPGCMGCGVHSGRANSCDRRNRCGVNFATLGCIRTTDAASALINQLTNSGDPLTGLTVTNHPIATNSIPINSDLPGAPTVYEPDK